MTDESKPVQQFKAPLLPATPLSAGAVGTFATALLAALAWIGQELVTLERVTTQAIERGQARQERFEEEIKSNADDIDDLQQRIVILERELLKYEVVPGGKNNE